MIPYHYFGSGSHMSASLKADYARVRKARPERYIVSQVNETSMDGTGKVTTVAVRAESKAMPLSPRDRHELSMAPFHALEPSMRGRS